MTYNVLIVDDHLVVREGLKFMIETNDNFQVVGEAENGVETLRLLESLTPDVILMDLNMPQMSGLETMKELKERNFDIPVVILTTYNEDELMISGLELGAKGYLLKDTGRDHLFRTIESAVRGDTLLQPEIMERVFAARNRGHDERDTSTEQTVLSEKERIVLQAIARGYRSKEIAGDMGISERTVKAHLTSIYNKLGVNSRSQAVAVAVERGIIQF
ncbi:chemotaxis protein CheY [Paenibacillus alvei TS-15]|jgi:two-component system, NarL family, response regulator YdfI|uniref:Chemotaxis protein CheY n=1 Tax=Paenibacillus alvei TS-15 TaxID=1117108 RepID=S9SGA5_PAEAL|nr:response regulator transcription factor [Paenibacillus alvei]EPY03794.1 chemotaxis protein CheY [Paenibacillus alvei TS-15]